jgi:hypothetical protein
MKRRIKKVVVGHPQGIYHSLRMEDPTEWKQAVVKELQALIDFGTWELD